MEKNRIEQYSRHILLPEIGFRKQEQLRNKSALIVGMGGLGCIQAIYLVCAGIGKLGLVDADIVDYTNLQRQIIYGINNVGEKKVNVARNYLYTLNNEPIIDIYDEFIAAENASQICSEYDIIIDSTDNFASHYLINDVCILLDKPHVLGSLFRFEGHVSFFEKINGPCYRCLYPEIPIPGTILDCEAGGVFNHVPGIIGLIQSAEVLKYLYDIKPSLIGELLVIDILSMHFDKIQFEKNTNCISCGKNQKNRDLNEKSFYCNEEKILFDREHEITAHELYNRINNKHKIILLDIREKEERTLNKIPGALAIPFSDLPQSVHQINDENEIILYCRTGIRSARARQFLRENGYTNVYNLRGGISAWIDEIEPGMIRY